MSDILFSDKIVNSSELRNNQKQWLETAVNHPITVNYGKKQLAVINREQLSEVYKAKYYLELVVTLCESLEKKGTSETLPWLNNLSTQEKETFKYELLTSSGKAVITDDWTEIEHLLEDWKATAEVNADAELSRILTTDENPEEYVELR